jgi:hypothetical protein
MIWLSRGRKPKLNRDTGEVATGGYAGRTTGPDGQADSALSFDALKNLGLMLHGELDGDFTIQFGFRE